MGLADEIADTLVRIEELLGRIVPLRQKAAATIQALDQTQSEYEEVVGPSDRESIRLEAAIAHARRLLAGIAVHRAVEEDTEPGRPATVTPPRGWEASQTPGASMSGTAYGYASARVGGECRANPGNRRPGSSKEIDCGPCSLFCGRRKRSGGGADEQHAYEARTGGWRDAGANRVG
jgi:hypothetical protein